MVLISPKIRTLINVLSIIVLCIICSDYECKAVVAKPGTLAYNQPFGQTLHINIYGDEKRHIRTSSDGYLLTTENDTLFFASWDSNLHIVKSPFKAADTTHRDSKTQAFLKTVDMLDISHISKILESKHFDTPSKFSSRSGQSSRFGLIPGSGFPCTGKQKVLVILVEYSDLTFNTGYNPKDYFYRMLNEKGFNDYGATGSASDYFSDNSSDKFQPTFDVYGPVKLPKPHIYYGANDLNGTDLRPAQMVIDACRMLDGEIDFAEYDRDNDGNIDNVFIFYAGRGEASGGFPTTIWPHSWNVNAYVDQPVILDGKTLGRYACTNEWDGEKPDGIGTFIHEFSHVLGLPDLYATSYTKSFTPGNWSVMDHGSYNNGGRTPPCYSNFERFSLGWDKPETITQTRDIEIDKAPYHSGYIIETADDREKFFIENRQQANWDKYCPGHGMLVWHVSYDENIWTSNTVNNNPAKQYVDIIEADNNPTDDSRDGDTFPGVSEVHTLSSQTHPDILNGANVDFSLENIREDNGTISLHCTMPLHMASPVAIEPTDIRDSQFTARWLPTDNANDYLITVYEKLRDGLAYIQNDFSEGIKLTGGWQTSTLMTGNSEANCGIAPPSLMFMQQGGYILSPQLDDIRSVSFWCKTNKTGTIYEYPQIIISGKIQEEFHELKSFSLNGHETGTTLQLDNIENGVSQIKIRIIGSNGISCYIDDVKLGYGHASELKTLEGFPLLTGNTDSFVVSGLNRSTTYAYQVSATDGDNISQPSEIIEVETAADRSSLTSSIPDKTSVSQSGNDIEISSPVSSDIELLSVDGRQILFIPSAAWDSSIRINTRYTGLCILRVGTKICKLLLPGGYR